MAKGKVEEKKPVTVDEEYNGSRVRLFFAVLRARLMMLVKCNLLVVVSLLPAIVVGIIFSMLGNAIFSIQPHSANLGIGFPAIFDSAFRANQHIFTNYTIFIFVAVAATIPLAFVALSGMFFTVRQIVSGKQVPVVKTFFRGIKRFAIPFLIVGFIVAAFVFVLTVGPLGFNYFLPGQRGLKIAMLVIFGLMALALLFILFFYTTISTTYRIGYIDLLRNSIKFAFMPKLLWRNLIVLILSSIPLVLLLSLMSVALVGMIFMIVAAFIGVSFMVLVWVIYAGWVFKNVATPKLSRPLKEKKPKVIKNIEEVSEEELGVREEEGREVSEEGLGASGEDEAKEKEITNYEETD